METGIMEAETPEQLLPDGDQGGTASANLSGGQAEGGHPVESSVEHAVGEGSVVESSEVTDDTWSRWSQGDGNILIVHEVEVEDPTSQAGLIGYREMEAHGDTEYPGDISSGHAGDEQPTTSSGEPAVVVQILTMSSSEMGQLLGGRVDPLGRNEALETPPESLAKPREVEQHNVTEQPASAMGGGRDIVTMAWSTSGDEHAQENSSRESRKGPIPENAPHSGMVVENPIHQEPSTSSDGGQESAPNENHNQVESSDQHDAAVVKHAAEFLSEMAGSGRSHEAHSEMEVENCEGPQAPPVGDQVSTGGYSQEQFLGDPQAESSGGYQDAAAMEDAAKSLLDTIRGLGRRIHEHSGMEVGDLPPGVPPPSEGGQRSTESCGGPAGPVGEGKVKSETGDLGSGNAEEGTATGPSESSDEEEIIYVTGEPAEDGDVGMAPSSQTGGDPVQILGDSELFREAAEKLGQIIGEHEVQFAYTCPVCQKEFSNAAAVRRHSRRHYQEKPHECSLCGKKFFRRGHCSRHEQSCKDKPFKCEICRCTRFNTEEALKEHMVRHRTRPGYKCDLCDASYLQPRGLREHRRSKHPETLPTDADKKASLLMACQHCQETFEDIESLQEHVTSKHSESDKTFKYKCKYCPQYFSKQRGRLVHYRTTHADKEGIKEGEHRNKGHQCDLCGKVMALNNAAYHLRTHTGERPFNCGWCEKCFTSRQNLREHMRVHSGEKPFKCRYCTMMFTASGSRVRHERKHTGEMPYSCSFCDKRFRSISGHEVHERTHTGATPYKCPHCPRSFTYKYKLDRHVASTHEEEQVGKASTSS